MYPFRTVDLSLAAATARGSLSKASATAPCYIGHAVLFCTHTTISDTQQLQFECRFREAFVSTYNMYKSSDAIVQEQPQSNISRVAVS